MGRNQERRKERQERRRQLQLLETGSDGFEVHAKIQRRSQRLRIDHASAIHHGYSSSSEDSDKDDGSVSAIPGAVRVSGTTTIEPEQEDLFSVTDHSQSYPNPSPGRVSSMSGNPLVAELAPDTDALEAERRALEEKLQQRERELENERERAHQVAEAVVIAKSDGNGDNSDRKICGMSRKAAFCVVVTLILVGIALGVVFGVGLLPSNPSNTSSSNEDNTTPGTSLMTTDAPTSAPTAQPPCIPLTTGAALKETIEMANGAKTFICSGRLVLEEAIVFSGASKGPWDVIDTDPPPIHFVCANNDINGDQPSCIVDGNNSTRLFSFGTDLGTETTSGEIIPVFYNITFEGFAFVNGLVGQPPTANGGAFAFVAKFRSIARFINCEFSDNASRLNNGGAIDAIEGPSTLIFENCSFLRNFAYLGGGISAINVEISIQDTRFINNTAVGGGEGSAIYVDSSDFQNLVGTLECLGDGNLFSGNSLPPDIVVVGPLDENCENYAIVNF